MKKTLTINLNGIVFHIDDDAYKSLQQYLADIAIQLGSGDDAKEIIADIEARIAELFTNILGNSKQEVVNIDMVNNVISTMGKPSDYGDGEENPQPSKQAKRRNKRFYRDTDNQILSGVCSGIAAYLGWDPVVVRILFIVMTIIGWWAVIPIYIIIWIIAPAAETAAQRLEMRGEDPTIENIKNEFTNAKNYVESTRFRTQATNFGQRLAQVIIRILKFCLTLIAAFFGFIAFIVIGALFLALVATLFGLGTGFFTMLPFSGFGLFGLTPWIGIILLISGILSIGIPVFSLIYGLAKFAKTRHWPSAGYLWSSLIIWIIATITLLVIGFSQLNWLDTLDLLDHQYSQTDGKAITEMRTVDPFHSVVVSGAFDVDLTQDPNQLLSIRTSEKYQESIETEVRDSILYITSNGNIQSTSVQISNADLRAFEASGACLLNSKNTIRQPVFNIKLAGAAKADLDVEIDSLFIIEAAGASKIELDGYAKNTDMRVMGASKIDANDMRTDNTKVYCAGGSKIRLWCNNDLKVQAYGASKVAYKGNPNLSERISVGASRISKE